VITLEQAWAAGFIDGEASIVVSNKGLGSLTLSVAQNNRETLERLQLVVPHGIIRGPITRSTGLSRKPYWTLRAMGRKTVIFLEHIWPVLTEATKHKVYKAYGNCLEARGALPPHIHSDIIVSDMKKVTG